MENGSMARCSDKSGPLPSCAPLATGYVPRQQKDSQRYDQRDALSNGTLYPGLNLPFHLAVRGSSVPAGTLSDYQALCFVVQELALYLDTHPDDTEAFSLFKQFSQMKKDARKAAENVAGPFTLKSAAAGEKYSWLNDPWPWNYEENEVK